MIPPGTVIKRFAKTNGASLFLLSFSIPVLYSDPGDLANAGPGDFLLVIGVPGNFYIKKGPILKKNGSSLP